MEGIEVLDGAAKVSAPGVGVEAPVVSKERWDELRRMRAAGQSVSQIARETGFDRKTVRASLARAEWAPYQREAVTLFPSTRFGPH